MTSVNGKDISLQRYIINNGYYSICFDNPKYMYFRHECFEDSSGISEIDSILEILNPKSELVGAQAEKGSVHDGSTDFEVNSLFKLAEGIHEADDYIFCDDLGDEWADLISFNKDDSCISFMHAKHGEESTSASNLHIVVGQGIKNLGNMYFQKDNFMRKYQGKLSKKYGNSQIERTRKGDSLALDEYLKNLLADYKLHRKCVLVCSFISKESIVEAFTSVKNGGSVHGHVIQLLWIISSFAHAAKDMNIIPIIYCKP